MKRMKLCRLSLMDLKIIIKLFLIKIKYYIE